MIQVRLLSGIRALAIAAVVAAGLGASSAQALPIDTRFLLNDRSFVAISSSKGYPTGSEFAVRAEDAGGGLINLIFMNVFFPVVDVGSGETFEIVLPGGQFTGVYDPDDGSVDVDSITVQITKKQGGSPTLQGNFTFDLTTGSQTRGQCGSAGPSTFFGSPLNSSTGGMELLENACIHQLGSDQSFNQVFSLRLAGVLEEVPTQAPEPAAALLLAFGLVALARARRAA